MMDTYNFVCLLGLLAATVIRLYFGMKANKRQVNQSKKASLDYALTRLVGFGFMLMPTTYFFTNFYNFAEYERPPLFGIVGTCLAGLGLFLFYRSHADLGEFWSPVMELKKEHQLVTAGVYSLVRHPMYTAFFIHSIAHFFLLSNFIVGPAAMVCFAILYLNRIDDEEKMMESQFSEYKEYKKRVPRLIPNLF